MISYDAFVGFLAGVASMFIAVLLLLPSADAQTEHVLIGARQINAIVPSCQLDNLKWERFLMYDHTPLYAPSTIEGRVVMETLFTP